MIGGTVVDEGTIDASTGGSEPDEVLANNVAHQLADLLEQWEIEPGYTTEHARGFRELDNVQTWRLHSHCVELARQVDDAVEALHDDGENMSMFASAVNRWYAAAYAVSTPFGYVHQGISGDGTFHELLDEGDRNLLRALGVVLEARNAIKLTRGDLQALEDALDDVRVLLAASVEGMPDDVRRYLRGLVSRAQGVLDMLMSVGPEAARRHMVELSGALRLRADVDEQSYPDRAKAMRELAMRVVTPFAAGAGGQAVKMLGSTAKAALEAKAGG